MPDTLQDVLKELVEIRERMERVEQRLTNLDRKPAQASGVRFPGEVDKEAERPVLEALRKRLGIPDQPPTFTRQEVREQMIRDGVRPEDRVGNTILAEMRGYSE